ncbi:MAG: hypothetical protein QT11_C0001G0880 [archaeon GW2011_AR20]|nr:MAG: hypothetical protein QT11_C0001G0880 [archaeon GW2011_AR20]MBS3160245.1 hypothetical protein [Candidatus Woesearchaeota archaeon]
MEKYGIHVLSNYRNIKEYLDLFLTYLAKSGKASEGFDGNRKRLITISRDKNENPYLLFDLDMIELVDRELYRWGIKPEHTAKMDYFQSAEKFIESGIIHKLIQKNSSLDLIVNDN